MNLGKNNCLIFAVIVFSLCGKTWQNKQYGKKSRVGKNIFSSLLARPMEVKLSIKPSSFKPKDFRGAQ